MKTKPVKMTYDIVFKKFFIDKPDILKLVLKHFLSLDSIQDIIITNPEIPELEEKGLKKKKKLNLSFLDSSLPVETLKGKRVFLDLRVKLSTGEDINVEMQSYYEEKFLSRILYYWARLHSQSLKKGENYNKITPTYSLVFTEEPFLNKRIKNFMSSFSIRRDKEPYVLFNEDLRIVIVELSKFKKSRVDLFDFKEFWCYFLKESGKLTREDRESLSRHKKMEEAMEHFDKLSNEERIRRNRELDEHMSEVIYQLNKQGIEEKLQKRMKQGMEKGMKQGMKQGMEKGMKQGLQQGRQAGRKELIFNMLKKNLEIKLISEVTGLSENEILKLKKGLKI